MYPTLVLSAALVAPAAPLPRDNIPNATGPAPRVLALKADNGGTVRVSGHTHIKQTITTVQIVIVNNNQVQKQVEYDTISSTYMNKALEDFNGRFATADGRPLTAAEATTRVKAGATVLASADGKPISKAWLQSVNPDTIVMVAEGMSHLQLHWGSEPLPATPPPQLTMLSAGGKGGAVARVTTAPASNDLIHHNEFQFDGRVGRVRNLQWRGGHFPNEVDQSSAKAASKPLADVSFEAYDLSGKLVPRSAALNRLAAGGMVLVAGDSRMPDAAYLKGFREDVLVLVGNELIQPIPLIDQTKKQKTTKPIRIFRD